jgi:hypothetical protein
MTCRVMSGPDICGKEREEQKSKKKTFLLGIPDLRINKSRHKYVEGREMITMTR